jgi:hypothetical protein
MATIHGPSGGQGRQADLGGLCVRIDAQIIGSQVSRLDPSLHAATPLPRSPASRIKQKQIQAALAALGKRIVARFEDAAQRAIVRVHDGWEHVSAVTRLGLVCPPGSGDSVPY